MEKKEYLELGRILVDFPLSYRIIKELTIKEEGNEHSSLNLNLVADRRVDREDVLRYENTPIQVYAPDGKCVYAGICTSMGFCCLNQYTELLIEAHSFSVLADVKPMERTFQDPSKKLGQIVDRVLGSYGYSVSVQEDVTVPFMLSQQNETDWAFIKRVANQLGFMVFADSHSAMKRISIGTVPFSSSSLPAESELQSLGKDISAFWQVKNGPAPGASAYEFLQEGYRSADLSFGAGYGITGGLSPQIVIKSGITATGGILVHSFVLAYQDGAYPGVSGIEEREGQASLPESSASKVTAATGAVNSSSVISGSVLAVSGTNVQVAFSDGSAGGVRWVPYCSFLGNDFYCMPDVGDTVYCYYENNGTIVCLGSRHTADSPDFEKPEEKVLTANNCMIRQKKDGMDVTGCRSQFDGQGGSKITILLSDTDGIEISAEKEVTIRAERGVLIQSTDLEQIQENPTEWFDTERKSRMETFDAEQAAGQQKYETDGGKGNYNAAWELAKDIGGQMWQGVKDDLLSPFQLISTLGSMGGSGEEAADTQEEPAVVFEKVEEYQVMILGLDRCTLQVPGASVRFHSNMIVLSGPKFWWFGLNRSSDYPEVSESQQTMMDTILDTVQLAIDIVGLIPGCNVICGALNAGISLVRGDYYGAVSGLVGMISPGAGLATRALKTVTKSVETAETVVKVLKILKAGAVGLNALLLGAEDVKELLRRWEEGTFSITDPEDLALLNSLGRNMLTTCQSGKDAYDAGKKPKNPQGDENAVKKDSGDETDPVKKKPEQEPEAAPEGSEQKPKNEYTCKDPIDVITGSQKITQTDFVVKDTTESFRLVRTYQSIYRNPGGLLGSRWLFNVGSWLTVDGEQAVVILPDMHLEHFRKTERGWENERRGDESVTLEEGREEYCLSVASEKKKYIYGKNGRLQQIVDRNGNSTWMRYTGTTLQEIRFAGGQCLRFRYEDGKLSEIKDVIGRTLRYRYEDELLTEVEYPNQGIIRYRYTPEGYLREITDQNGQTYVHNEYDADGRVTRQLLSNGQEYIVLYDDANRVNTFLTPSIGQRTEYHYNRERLLTKTVYTDGTCEERGYDGHQNCNYYKDRRGNELHRSFDSHGNLLKEERPGGLVTEYAYDEAGNRIREWDNGGRIREMSYDSRGNRVLFRERISADYWQETAYTYDRYGHLCAIRDANGNTMRMRYQESRPGIRSLTTPEGYTSYYTYDDTGCCMSMSDDLGKTEYTYNQMDYRVYVKDPLGNTTKYCFDRLCNLVQMIRPNQLNEKTGEGVGTKYLYDEMDEQIRRIDPLGNVSAMVRDLEGRVIREIHPESYDAKTGDGDGVCYEYDPDGRRIRILYPDGGTERIFYDANGNIIKKIQPEQYDRETDSGAGYCYDYDSENRLLQITDPEGTVTKRYVYDLHGNITKEINADGYLSAETDGERTGTLYRYTSTGWLTEKREPVMEEDGEVRYRLTAYRYDPAGNMTQEIRYLDFQKEEGASGAVHILTFAYDRDNRRIRVSDNTGAEAAYAYNCRNQCISEKRKLGEDRTQTIRYAYDAAGRLVRRTVPSGKADGSSQPASTLYEYDKSGNCIRVRLPEGGEIRREYDAADRLVSETHIDKKSGICNHTAFAYDKAGNLTCITDNRGRKTVIVYDLLDQEIRRTGQDGSVTRRFYNRNGLPEKVIRPNEYELCGDHGAGYRYTYDLQGRLQTVTGPDGHVLVTNTYDAVGNLIRRTEGAEGGAVFSYNLAGDRTVIRSAGNAAQEFSYDARGNITGVADGNRNRTEYALDAWGRVTEIQKADGSTEQYSYDHAGNILRSVDGEGNETTYTYDCAGNLTAVTDALGYTEQYVYDKEGRLAEKTDKNGVTTAYAFNFYGAPLYRREKGSLQGDFYEYTPEGLLKSAISGRMAYSYTYDAMGRLSKKSASGRTLLSLEYDGNGNRIRQTDVTGKTTEYRFDLLDRLTEVWDDGEKLAEYGYYPDGTIRREIHGPLTKEYAYDADRNLTGLKIQCGDSLLADNHYTYDGNGNRLEKQQLSGTTRYAYDALNQLVKAEYPTYGEELFYDRAGNRTRRRTAGVEEAYAYDAGNHLLSHTKDGIKTVYEYDKAGNLLKDDKAAYSYDAFNRQTAVETFDGNIQINRYDAEGLRHEMEENGRLVQFIFRGTEVVVEETQEEKIRYIRAEELLASDAESARTYYHYASDEMSSITHVTDEEGNILNRYEYDAWGNLTVEEEQVPNRFKYTGEQFDPITQQYYLRVRFYNPVLARFMQEDTYRGDGLNLYAYCANNPVRYVDPSGHEKTVPFSDKVEGELAKEIAFAKEYGTTVYYDTPLANKVNEMIKQNQTQTPKADIPNDVRRGEGGSGAVGGEKDNIYIPKDADGNPIPLAKQTVNGQDIPLPDPNATGPHTVLGGKVSSETGEIYRQSATFPEGTWPPVNGQNVPWSEVHWTNHGRGDHTNPHQHIFEYNPDKGGWIRGKRLYF